jgi:hypothetical protein
VAPAPVRATRSESRRARSQARGPAAGSHPEEAQGLSGQRSPVRRTPRQASGPVHVVNGAVGSLHRKPYG